MAGAMHDHYDALWATAHAAFAANSPALDPQLADRAGDRRRGATLIIRPNAAVAARIAQVLNELRLAEPQQYYYRPEELHVTVLSLFTGTDRPEPFLAQLPTYCAAIEPVLAAAPAVCLRFDGLTASPAAILVQGFSEEEGLNNLRNALRSAIAAAGLGHNLDQRYRISAAHMTAVRFRQPLQDSGRLAQKLQALRRCDFGEMQATAVHLVENDWYMSHDRVRLLHTYPLR